MQCKRDLSCDLVNQIISGEKPATKELSLQACTSPIICMRFDLHLVPVQHHLWLSMNKVLCNQPANLCHATNCSLTASAAEFDLKKLCAPIFAGGGYKEADSSGWEETRFSKHLRCCVDAMHSVNAGGCMVPGYCSTVVPNDWPEGDSLSIGQHVIRGVCFTVGYHSLWQLLAKEIGHAELSCWVSFDWKYVFLVELQHLAGSGTVKIKTRV